MLLLGKVPGLQVGLVGPGVDVGDRPRDLPGWGECRRGHGNSRICRKLLVESDSRCSWIEADDLEVEGWRSLLRRGEYLPSLRWGWYLLECDP